MPQTDLAVFCNRTGYAETLKTYADIFGGLDSALVTGFFTLFESNGATAYICPFGILETDRLSLFTDLIRIYAITVTTFIPPPVKSL
jgi:hypothetical protein